MLFTVSLIGEIAHVRPALYGIGLSYGLTSDIDYNNFDKQCEAFRTTIEVANKLAHKQGGHNKFLETITITLNINAPRYWWSQFDTYRVGVTKQSESTMHTLMKRPLDVGDFIRDDVDFVVIHTINNYIEDYRLTDDYRLKTYYFNKVKALLPEGFMQRRIVCLNLKTLQNMYMQRKNHKLAEWHLFFECLKTQLSYQRLHGIDFYDWVFGEDKEENKEVETNLSHIKNLSTEQACTIFETLWDTCTCDLVCDNDDEPCDEECTKHMHEWLNKPYDGSLDAYLIKKEKEDND